MDLKDVDFKTYMRQKLDEEAALAAAPQAQPAAAPMSGAASMIAQYVKNGDLKEGFKNLAQDLVQAIVDYAKNQVVSEDQFDSIDAKAKYENFVDQKIGLTAGGTMVDLFRHIRVLFDIVFHRCISMYLRQVVNPAAS